MQVQIFNANFRRLRFCKPSLWWAREIARGPCCPFQQALDKLLAFLAHSQTLFHGACPHQLKRRCKRLRSQIAPAFKISNSTSKTTMAAAAF